MHEFAMHMSMHELYAFICIYLGTCSVMQKRIRQTYSFLITENDKSNHNLNWICHKQLVLRVPSKISGYDNF